MSILVFIAITVVILETVVALLAAIFYSKLKEENRVLAWIAFFALFMEVIAYSFAINRIQNWFITHIYAVVEFTLIALMFSKATRTYISKKIYYYSIAIFILFSIVNIIFFEPITSFNSLGRALQSTFIIGFCFIYFFQLLNQLKVKQLFNVPFFWITCACLLYFAGSLFASLFMNVKVTPDFFAFAYGIVIGLNIIKNIIYAIAIWLAGKQVEKKEEEYAIE